MKGIVIIGAGECGVRAAFALREKSYAKPVKLIGAEATLPYERPPLSKSVHPEPRPIRNEQNYREADINLRLGTRAESVNTTEKQVRLSDGSLLSYAKLLFATGARARLFPGMDGCLTLRTQEDAERIVSHFGQDRNIGIIGGGFIGLELAASARLAGSRVTVIEAAPRLMQRAVPMQIATRIQARHEMEGVEVRTGTGVVSANATQIELGDGTRLSFDLVIAGVGAVPETALAAAAGLSVDNGILVDGTFKTSAADVFAAGDCCNFAWRGRRIRLESWRAAQDQGEYVAAAMLGQAASYTKVPWFWSDQYELSLQVAGIFDLDREMLERPVTDQAVLYFQLDEAGKVSAAAGVGPGNSVAKSIRLAEMLIEHEVSVDREALCDPTVDLKRVLRAAQSRGE